MALLVAPDVPQNILDIFNKIDFTKINFIQKNGFLLFLKNWVKQNLPLKNAGQKYPNTGGPKRISKDFDKQFLDMLNLIDYGNVTPEQMQFILDFTSKYLNNLPQKA